MNNENFPILVESERVEGNDVDLENPEIRQRLIDSMLESEEKSINQAEQSNILRMFPKEFQKIDHNLVKSILFVEENLIDPFEDESFDLFDGSGETMAEVALKTRKNLEEEEAKYRIDKEKWIFDRDEERQMRINDHFMNFGLTEPPPISIIYRIAEQGSLDFINLKAMEIMGDYHGLVGLIEDGDELNEKFRVDYQRNIESLADYRQKFMHDPLKLLKIENISNSVEQEFIKERQRLFEVVESQERTLEQEEADTSDEHDSYYSMGLEATLMIDGKFKNTKWFEEAYKRESIVEQVKYEIHDYLREIELCFKELIKSEDESEFETCLTWIDWLDTVSNKSSEWYNQFKQDVLLKLNRLSKMERFLPMHERLIDKLNPTGIIQRFVNGFENIESIVGDEINYEQIEQEPEENRWFNKLMHGSIDYSMTEAYSELETNEFDPFIQSMQTTMANTVFKEFTMAEDISVTLPMSNDLESLINRDYVNTARDYAKQNGIDVDFVDISKIAMRIMLDVDFFDTIVEVLTTEPYAINDCVKTLLKEVSPYTCALYFSLVDENNRISFAMTSPDKIISQEIEEEARRSDESVLLRHEQAICLINEIEHSILFGLTHCFDVEDEQSYMAKEQVNSLLKVSDCIIRQAYMESEIFKLDHYNVIDLVEAIDTAHEHVQAPYSSPVHGNATQLSFERFSREAQAYSDCNALKICFIEEICAGLFGVDVNNRKAEYLIELSAIDDLGELNMRGGLSEGILSRESICENMALDEMDNVIEDEDYQACIVNDRILMGKTFVNSLSSKNRKFVGVKARGNKKIDKMTLKEYLDYFMVEENGDLEQEVIELTNSQFEINNLSGRTENQKKLLNDNFLTGTTALTVTMINEVHKRGLDTEYALFIRGLDRLTENTDEAATILEKIKDEAVKLRLQEENAEINAKNMVEQMTSSGGPIYNLTRQIYKKIEQKKLDPEEIIASNTEAIKIVQSDINTANLAFWILESKPFVKGNQKTESGEFDLLVQHILTEEEAVERLETETKILENIVKEAIDEKTKESGDRIRSRRDLTLILMETKSIVMDKINEWTNKQTIDNRFIRTLKRVCATPDKFKENIDKQEFKEFVAKSMESIEIGNQNVLQLIVNHYELANTMKTYLEDSFNNLDPLKVDETLTSYFKTIKILDSSFLINKQFYDGMIDLVVKRGEFMKLKGLTIFKSNLLSPDGQLIINQKIVDIEKSFLSDITEYDPLATGIKLDKDEVLKLLDEAYNERTDLDSKNEKVRRLEVVGYYKQSDLIETTLMDIARSKTLGSIKKFKDIRKLGSQSILSELLVFTAFMFSGFVTYSRYLNSRGIFMFKLQPDGFGSIITEGIDEYLVETEKFMREKFNRYVLALGENFGTGLTLSESTIREHLIDQVANFEKELVNVLKYNDLRGEEQLSAVSRMKSGDKNIYMSFTRESALNDIVFEDRSLKFSQEIEEELEVNYIPILNSEFPLLNLVRETIDDYEGYGIRVNADTGVEALEMLNLMTLESYKVLKESLVKDVGPEPLHNDIELIEDFFEIIMDKHEQIDSILMNGGSVEYIVSLLGNEYVESEKEREIVKRFDLMRNNLKKFIDPQEQVNYQIKMEKIRNSGHVCYTLGLNNPSFRINEVVKDAHRFLTSMPNPLISEQIRKEVEAISQLSELPPAQKYGLEPFSIEYMQEMVELAVCERALGYNSVSCRNLYDKSIYTLDASVRDVLKDEIYRLKTNYEEPMKLRLFYDSLDAVSNSLMKNYGGEAVFTEDYDYSLRLKAIWKDFIKEPTMEFVMQLIVGQYEYTENTAKLEYLENFENADMSIPFGLPKTRAQEIPEYIPGPEKSPEEISQESREKQEVVETLENSRALPYAVEYLNFQVNSQFGSYLGTDWFAKTFYGVGETIAEKTEVFIEQSVPKLSWTDVGTTINNWYYELEQRQQNQETAERLNIDGEPYSLRFMENDIKNRADEAQKYNEARNFLVNAEYSSQLDSSEIFVDDNAMIGISITSLMLAMVYRFYKKINFNTVDKNLENLEKMIQSNEYQVGSNDSKAMIIEEMTDGEQEFEIVKDIDLISLKLEEEQKAEAANTKMILKSLINGLEIIVPVIGPVTNILTEFLTKSPELIFTEQVTEVLNKISNIEIQREDRVIVDYNGEIGLNRFDGLFEELRFNNQTKALKMFNLLGNLIQGKLPIGSATEIFSNIKTKFKEVLQTRPNIVIDQNNANPVEPEQPETRKSYDETLFEDDGTNIKINDAEFGFIIEGKKRTLEENKKLEENQNEPENESGENKNQKRSDNKMKWGDDIQLDMGDEKVNVKQGVFTAKEAESFNSQKESVSYGSVTISFPSEKETSSMEYTFRESKSKEPSENQKNSENLDDLLKDFDAEFDDKDPYEFNVDIEPDDENVEFPNEVKDLSYFHSTEYQYQYAKVPYKRLNNLNTYYHYEKYGLLNDPELEYRTNPFDIEVQYRRILNPGYDPKFQEYFDEELIKRKIEREENARKEQEEEEQEARKEPENQSENESGENQESEVEEELSEVEQSDGYRSFVESLSDELIDLETISKNSESEQYSGSELSSNSSIFESAKSEFKSTVDSELRNEIKLGQIPKRLNMDLNMKLIDYAHSSENISILLMLMASLKNQVSETELEGLNLEPKEKKPKKRRQLKSDEKLSQKELNDRIKQNFSKVFDGPKKVRKNQKRKKLEKNRLNLIRVF